MKIKGDKGLKEVKKSPSLSKFINSIEIVVNLEMAKVN